MPSTQHGWAWNDFRSRLLSTMPWSTWLSEHVRPRWSQWFIIMFQVPLVVSHSGPWPWIARSSPMYHRTPWAVAMEVPTFMDDRGTKKTYLKKWSLSCATQGVTIKILYIYINDYICHTSHSLDPTQIIKFCIYTYIYIFLIAIYMYIYIYIYYRYSVTIYIYNT